MILQLDMGNSATKWRLDSTRGRLVEGSLLPALETRPAAVWVASVADANREAELASEAKARWGLAPWFARSSAAACGVSNSYAEPERMGVDRWLAMIAAYQRIAGPVCVIDAGSALTIDFVATDGRHRGGYILPGMAMMERSLLGETARVRFGDAPRDRIEPRRRAALRWRWTASAMTRPWFSPAVTGPGPCGSSDAAESSWRTWCWTG